MLYMLLAANNFTSDIDIIAHSTDVAPLRKPWRRPFWLKQRREVGIAKAEEWGQPPGRLAARWAGKATAQTQKPALRTTAPASCRAATCFTGKFPLSANNLVFKPTI